MVVSLSLVHPKGANVAGRYWPHSGHLGLTPLSLSGIIRVRKEGDSALTSHPNVSAASSSAPSVNGPLRASAVTVSLRCYEARLGRVGVVRTNILFEHTLSLWSATNGNNNNIESVRLPNDSSSPASSSKRSREHEQVVADLPQSDFPFQITIPPSSAGGCSTCHLQNYRVYWRLESTVHHIQAQGYGPRLTKHSELGITRYDDPTLRLSSGPSSSPSTSTSYSYTTPSSAPSYPSSSKPYIAKTLTVPVSSHPNILAFTTSRPQYAVGPLETFGVTFALTVRRPCPSSILPGGSAGGLVPLKVSASVKRVVEVYDEEQPLSISTNSSPTPDNNTKGKSRGLLSRGFSANATVTEKSSPASPRQLSSSQSSSPRPKRPPTAPSASTARPSMMPSSILHPAFLPASTPNNANVASHSQTVPVSISDKRNRHKSLTPEMERQLFLLHSPSTSPEEARTVVMGSTSGSSSTAIGSEEEMGTSADEDDSTSELGGESGMDVDLPRAPALAVPTPPQKSSGFSLFEKRLWSSKSSGDADGSASPVKEKKGDDRTLKTTLLTESASFSKRPVDAKVVLESFKNNSASAPSWNSENYRSISTSSSSSSIRRPPSDEDMVAVPRYSISPSDSTPILPIYSSTANLLTDAGPSEEEKTMRLGDTYTSNVQLHIPTPKSTHHWGTGETLVTSMARIKFIIGCKVTLATPTGGTETWKAPETEVVVTTVDDRSRAKIVADYELATRQHQQHVFAQRPPPPSKSSSRSSSLNVHQPSAQRRKLSPSPARGSTPTPSIQTTSSSSSATIMPSSSAQLAPPRESTESSVSTISASSFVTISATAPSAPNGGRSVSTPVPTNQMNMATMGSNNNGGSGKLSFFERRSARKTPPPQSQTSSPAPVSTVSAVPIPIARPSGAPPTPRPGRRPKTSNGVPETTATQGSGSGIGMRRRRLSLSPPPPVRPSPSHMSSQSPSASRPQPPLSSSSRYVAAGTGSIPATSMRAWEEELDRIAMFSKRRSMMPGSQRSGEASPAPHPKIVIG